MYFPFGWPKALNLSPPGEDAIIVNHVCCDSVKILIAVVGDNFIGIWYANPLIPIVFYKRNQQSVADHGANSTILWRPDSRQLLILTKFGKILLYQIGFETNKNGIFIQIDSPSSYLKRESAELFIKDIIPRLSLKELRLVTFDDDVTAVCCLSVSELLIATKQCKLIRIDWDSMGMDVERCNDNNAMIRHSMVPLNMIKVTVQQQCNRNFSLKGIPSISPDSYIIDLEYSPFIGGCAAVFNDKRAVFLNLTHSRFDETNIRCYWITEIEYATVCSVNHKYRLMAFGCEDSSVLVYTIDDRTGNVEYTHRLSMETTSYSCVLGAVNELKWSPDGCVLAVTWTNGGVSLWSTFGVLLMSTLQWDFGIHVDLVDDNPLRVNRLEWSTEGYQLLMTCQVNDKETSSCQSSNATIGRSTSSSSSLSSSLEQPNVFALNFIKSAMSVNPYTAFNSHVLLQGDGTLYLNQGDNLAQIYSDCKFKFPNCSVTRENNGDVMEIKKSVNSLSILAESKSWSVLQLPSTYGDNNWPIRYSAVDDDGLHLAVAGRAGIAHYSMDTKKWKLFGNETQEKDFVVAGGLLWWNEFIIMGCYSLVDRTDEIRCYPEQNRLDNQYGMKIQVDAPVTSLNIFRNQLIILTGNGIISLYALVRNTDRTLNVQRVYDIDVKNICIHPACIISLTATDLRYSLSTKTSPSITKTELAETVIVNICGRVMIIHHDSPNSVTHSLMATCLASCVEFFWLSNSYKSGSFMQNCLWLYCGSHGMRVWLPTIPPLNKQVRPAEQCLHTFVSKRIMLSFPLKLYPLVILFDNVVLLGVETNTTLFSNEKKSYFSLPFCWLEQKSQVFLHKILRQLIKRNLGYNAWEIAKSCRSLPYFPHSLELLLHEVLEEEATSKEPIPDALLPSVLDFIKEFPVYLQTIVQCARKTEIALWPHLFSIAGKPKDLFQLCFQNDDIQTAASYLIILQNLEPSNISKHYATLLLDIALHGAKWELAKELIRFLRAIDPKEIESPRSSMMINTKINQTPTIGGGSSNNNNNNNNNNNHQNNINNNNSEVFNLLLGTIPRERSFSTTTMTNFFKDKKSDKSINQPTPITPSSSIHVEACNAQPSTSLTTANNSSNSSSNNMQQQHHHHQHQHQQQQQQSQHKSSETQISSSSLLIMERKEMFYIEVILKRHACKLIEKCKLLSLGYMSAFLDFHLVTWLSEESERSAKLNDIVAALIALHEEFELMPPMRTEASSAATKAATASLSSSSSMPFDTIFEHNTKVTNAANIDDYGDDSPKLFHRANHMIDNSESGYGSLPIKNMQNYSYDNGHHHHYHANMAAIAAASSSSKIPHTDNDYDSDLCDQQISRVSSLESKSKYIRFFSMNDSLGVEKSLCSFHTKTNFSLSRKHEVKIRYLLQLFVEANCTDYALLLSILLQDIASIGRIINTVIRSESLTSCKRIEAFLKNLTQWSFNGDCVYRPVMICLQPHIYLLDQFITTYSMNPKSKYDDFNMKKHHHHNHHNNKDNVDMIDFINSNVQESSLVSNNKDWPINHNQDFIDVAQHEIANNSIKKKLSLYSNNNINGNDKRYNFDKKGDNGDQPSSCSIIM